jgi:metal-dependent amidase/aminoacylase/carboxypeptidase family protein
MRAKPTTPDTVDQIVRETEPWRIAYRRDSHRHAESGWPEFRMASRVAPTLADLRYEVHTGRDVLLDEKRLGLPEPDVLQQHRHRGKAQGADPEYLEAMRGGFTGVARLLRHSDMADLGSWGHHTAEFDIDQRALALSTRLLSMLVPDLVG